MRLALRRLAALLVALHAANCERAADIADPSSPAYAEAVTVFYRGVAAVDVGESGVARASFQRLVELAPDEPAGWANLGLVMLQRRELDEAAEHLETARRLAPDDARIVLLSALVAREGGEPALAAEQLRRTVELDPNNARALYLLAQAAEQQDPADGRAEASHLIDRILAVRPDNRAAWLDKARLAATLGDAPAVRRALDRVEQLSAGAAPRVATELREVRGALDGDLRDAATQIAFLDAALQELAEYRADRAALAPPPGYTDLALNRFLRLPVPPVRTASADRGLAFDSEPLVAGAHAPQWVRAIWLSEEVPLAVMAARSDSLWIGTETDWSETLAFAGPASDATVPVTAVAALDLDSDFRVDLALVGRGGLRLYRQQEDGSFTDVTGSAIPPSATGRAYAGVWSADLDMEGDLDLVLGPIDGPATALRNRGDGSFEPWPLFEDVARLRDFVWGDLDGDGTADAALLGADGSLHIQLNQRSATPRFLPTPAPVEVTPVRALASGDLDRDGRIDLVLLLTDGRLVRVSRPEDAWRVAPLTEWTDFAVPAGTDARLFVADLDNNGALDLAVGAAASTRTWLSAGPALQAGPAVDARVTSIGDLSGEGRLDLLGIAQDGSPVWFENRGTRDYYAVTIQPRATPEAGDRRINSFGVGGEIEVRSALLYQKQTIQSPAVHFGLGEHTRLDVARIVWPNGSVQAEFNVSGDNQATVARQRLKGSCPWVFAHDGQGMRFITDFLWRTALGLRINAQGAAAVIHSEDWIRIPGNRLAARDGFYDVRITAELWETHFLDHVALMAVDHPSGTEVFVDERFTLPAPEPAIRAFAPLRPVARAWDHERRDVTSQIQAQDGKYLDTFRLGPYQGIAEEHYVEVELGDDAMDVDRLWLIAHGWVYPTDSSINLAIGQGMNAMPRGVQLEVADGGGGWRIVQSDLGFPAGKAKTVLIDLQGVFAAGAPRRIRLRTNMEIYWDHLAWAEGDPDASLVMRRMLPETAELRYRGFSEVTQASRRAPELPHYDRIAGTAPQWLDLVGFHTRFGDVRPLIREVDDRYVIMNAGDEVILRFPALPLPAEGSTRDFVLIGDGWVKDGDFNTGFSKTVLPLPYHGLADYARSPGRLEDDPAYRRHPADWRTFHTRYVTPHSFRHALIPDSR